MPDLDTLELLGFRAYPRWFREMPRDFQMLNSTEFNEAGLDPHRGQHWRQGGVRVPQTYSPAPNGPQGGNFAMPPQQQQQPQQPQPQQPNPAFTHNRFGSNGYSTYHPGQGFVPRGPPPPQSPQSNQYQAQSPFNGAQNGQQQVPNGQNGRPWPQATPQNLQNGIVYPPPGLQYPQGQNNVNMQGVIPYGRVFTPGAPGSGPSNNSNGGRVHTPGSDTTSTGPGSPTMSTYHRRDSVFSTTEPPADRAGTQWKVLTPVPQPAKLAGTPTNGNNRTNQQPQHRSLYDGAPPSPDPQYKQRFTDPKFQKAKFVTPPRGGQGGKGGNGGQKNGRGGNGIPKGPRGTQHAAHAQPKVNLPKTTTLPIGQPKPGNKAVAMVTTSAVKEEDKPAVASTVATVVDEVDVLVDVKAEP